jgi:hypothetical protein
VIREIKNSKRCMASSASVPGGRVTRPGWSARRRSYERNPVQGFATVSIRLGRRDFPNATSTTGVSEPTCFRLRGKTQKVTLSMRFNAGLDLSSQSRIVEELQRNHSAIRLKLLERHQIQRR